MAVLAGLKKAATGTFNFAKRHQLTTGAAAGYVVGVGAGKSSPYGDTPNQGRAVNKHPQGGYYG